MSSIYVETSVISYLVARPSRDGVTLARQRQGTLWWEEVRRTPTCKSYVSPAVDFEARRGDPSQARLRLDIVESLPMLPVSTTVLELARQVRLEGIVPDGEESDAAHLAFAVHFGMDYLVSWNFKHLANPVVVAKLGKLCERLGHRAPVICSPETHLKEVLRGNR